MIRGSCLCGAVAFELDGPLAAPSVCHCSLCRRMSGHVWASTHVRRGALRMVRDGALSWYRASAAARRGFCATCGSSLFWDPAGEDRISVAMGALEAPTGVTLGRHIFVADKGDYYAIADHLPQSD